MFSHLSSKDHQVIDSRPSEKYIAGHYPGAFSVPFAASLLNKETGTLKPVDELKKGNVPEQTLVRVQFFNLERK